MSLKVRNAVQLPNIRYLYIAKGSAAELRTQLYIVIKIGTIITEEKAKEHIFELREISNMLYGLIKSLKS